MRGYLDRRRPRPRSGPPTRAASAATAGTRCPTACARTSRCPRRCSRPPRRRRRASTTSSSRARRSSRAERCSAETYDAAERAAPGAVRRGPALGREPRPDPRRHQVRDRAARRAARSWWSTRSTRRIRRATGTATATSARSPRAARPRRSTRSTCGAGSARRATRATGPPPELPIDVRCEASRRYIEAFEQITGRDFEPDTEDPRRRIARNLGIALGSRFERIA